MELYQSNQSDKQWDQDEENEYYRPDIGHEP